MDPKNCPSLGDVPSVSTGTVNWVAEVHRKAQMECHEESPVAAAGMDVDIDLREIYFLIMHFLSAGPCRKTFEQFWNELLEYELLPRRYHACYSRSDAMNADGNDNGKSIPLNYGSLVGRYSHIEKDHLVKLLKQLMLTLSPPLRSMDGRVAPSAADVPTLIGSGSFSLLSCEREKANEQARTLPSYLRWPHLQADQVRGLSLREIGGGFSKHHRAPSIRFACYAIAKPSSMVGKMQNVKKLRGHRDAVYCGIVLSLDSALTNITSAIFDRSGRYVITGSDDRLVKIWSMETAFCLASCRGHEGDITDLSVSSNNAVVASASNDFSIRVWRLPDGHPISVLHGHTGAVTAIAFSPRVKPLNAVYQLLSSSDDGTCRVWDARYSQCSPQVYMPKSIDNPAARNSGLPSAGASSTTVLQGHQILCCAYNANGTFFVTGSSDTYARVWSASRPIADDLDQPIHEIDKLAGHENDVNYVQFSGCTVASRALPSDSYSEDSIPKFRNSWFNHDNIVTCSRDGSAIIWIPRSRRFNGKVGRWVQAYHLKVPPPPMPPRPPRGGPRQRLLPTPRGVNMIMWSLDNRFVLAAIMDNRICVWNANDGSLVHCLAGHTASTYVLDVHPFNPRIIMSAGYDGKMILWDIWEGTPIRVYDIVGRFKLVDGKFSQDGMSIVLSDDVGQIYLIDTGEGESQKDAKYDQFFLGDYRPLAQDTLGSVVDQETQLSAYVRNIQDPICDSSMLPYPEPYQSMFQRRRLGALGIEWRPSSIKFAVGTDIGFGQEFQILPLADLDAVFEPMPDYLDAVYWEPENDGMNDENDSEYNVNEDYLSDVQACHSGSTSSDSDCSKESKVRRHHKDSIRRSKRKKTESDVEMVTYSGRRVKKRNALERRGSLSRCKRSKKLEIGPGTSRTKSSQSKSLRPLRIAARNAINSFSQITESCSEEDDEDDLTGDSSNCESSLEGSASQMQGQNDNLPSWPRKYSVDASSKPPDSQTSAESRKKLVLKIPLRHHSKPPFPENLTGQPQGQTSVASSTLIAHEYNPEDGGVHSGSGDPESASTCVIYQEHSERYSRQSTDVNKPTEADNKLRTTPDGGGSLSWGKVKIRPPNDTQLGNVVLLSNGSFPHGDQDKPTLYDNSLFRDHTQMDSDSGLSNKQNVPDGGKGSFNNCEFSNLNNVANSRPTNDVRKKPIILKIKQPKPLQNSPSKLPSQGPSDASLSATGDSTSERLSLMLEKPLCGPMAETGSDPNYMPYCDILGRDFESNISLHNPELLTDLPDMATDAVRRSRSFNVKVAMKEKVHDAIEMDGEYLLPGTSRGSEKSSKRDLYESPSQRWISMSSHTIRSRSQRENSNHGSKRLNWLLLTEPEEEDRYIPQLADEVVYLRQGHQEYIESLGTSNTDPWWKYRDELRAVEICLVENLKYKTNPGSGCSCCKITLKLIDPSGHLFGQNFQVTLTELHDFPDFIVEKTRYDAAMERNWRIMDECRVWWRDENKEDGTWWNCRIVDIKDKSSDFPDSPWEKYIVQYETDDTLHRHCPWEFFDSSTSWDPPNIDISTRESVKSYLTDLLKKASKHKDQYGILKLNQDAQKPGFINRFPVPLSPEIIMLRLENNYYRSLDALRHDVNIMLSNAESYFSRNTDILKKLKRLSNCFLNLLRDS